MSTLPSADPTAMSSVRTLPRPYTIWLVGTVLSLLGTHVLGFGLAWYAASSSPLLAGLVLTMVNLPRALLLLTGGAVADRVGPWRVMLLGDAAMLTLTAGLALVLTVFRTPTALLLAAALAVGVVDAFYLPASGAVPRRLVPAALLPRALAARQLGGQLAALTGAPLGGQVVSAAGLGAAALLDAVTFALMLIVLLLLRPFLAEAEPTATPGPGLWTRSLEGLWVVWSVPQLRTSVLLATTVASLLLPISSLLIAVLSRERAWSAGTAGTLIGAVALGTAAVAGPAGVLLAAGGVAALALPVPERGAVLPAAIVGSGPDCSCPTSAPSSWAAPPRATSHGSRRPRAGPERPAARHEHAPGSAGRPLGSGGGTADQLVHPQPLRRGGARLAGPARRG